MPHLFERRVARRASVSLLVGALACLGARAAAAQEQGEQQGSVAPAGPPPADSAGAPVASAPPFAAFGASARALRDSVVALARAQVGLRYVLGGTSPERGFDCSGLVKYVMAALRIDLPRTAREQAFAGRAVARDTARLRPGDLLTFGGKRVTHIGIYVGGGRFIHASTKAGRVIESPLFRRPARGIKPWRGARTVIAAADTGAT